MRQMGHLTQYMHVRDGLKHAPAGVKTKGPQKKNSGAGCDNDNPLRDREGRFFIAGIAEARPCTVNWRRRR